MYNKLAITVLAIILNFNNSFAQELLTTYSQDKTTEFKIKLLSHDNLPLDFLSGAMLKITYQRPGFHLDTSSGGGFFDWVYIPSGFSKNIGSQLKVLGNKGEVTVNFSDWFEKKYLGKSGYKFKKLKVESKNLYIIDEEIECTQNSITMLNNFVQRFIITKDLGALKSKSKFFGLESLTIKSEFPYEFLLNEFESIINSCNEK